MSADGFRTLAQIMAEHEARWRPFWTCPISGFDCRNEPRPALAIIYHRRTGVRFQMHATPSLADRVSPRIILCAHGMTADYLLDCWLHWGAKTWMDAAAFAEVMHAISWHFGSKSWAWCAGSDNPLIVGRAA